MEQSHLSISRKFGLSKVAAATARVKRIFLHAVYEKQNIHDLLGLFENSVEASDS